MEPIPQTRHTLRELRRTSGSDLEGALRGLSDLVVDLVPSCVGLSLSVNGAGLTFTMVSTAQVAAALDGVQYLDGGPCVDSAHHGAELSMEDALSEDRWHEYALAAASAGVRSSLSIPVLRAGEVVGAVNLYAGDSRAFEGRHEALRALVGSSTGLAATNADLSFRSRTEAEAAPRLLRDRDVVETAVGYLAASHGVAVHEARSLLHETADRAAVDVLTLARTMLHLPTDDREN